MGIAAGDPLRAADLALYDVREQLDDHLHIYLSTVLTEWQLQGWLVIGDTDDG